MTIQALKIGTSSEREERMRIGFQDYDLGALNKIENKDKLYHPGADTKRPAKKGDHCMYCDKTGACRNNSGCSDSYRKNGKKHCKFFSDEV